MIRLLCICVMILALPTAAHAQSVIRPIETPDGFTGGPVLVQFRSGGYLDAVERDLGVFTAEGEPVPFRVLGHESEGVTSLAIDMPEAPVEAFVHYGSNAGADAQHLETQSDLPISLIMRTYPLERASFRDVRDLERAIDSARPLGVAGIERVFFGHNPFGRDKRFITDIQGLIRVSDTTTLRLFSNHDTAAFVRIGDELVIAGTEPFTERDYHAVDHAAREITLEAGEHRFRYLHVATDDSPRLALGMIDGQRARAVPPRYFVQHPRATLGRPQASEGERPIVGFDAEQRDRMGHEDYEFTRYALQPLAPPPEGHRYRWDFGDTTTAERADGERFDHVFPGPHDALPQAADENGWRVRLELIDERGRSVGQATSRLKPVVFGHTRTAADERLLERYAAAIATPDYDRAAGEVLLALYRLLAETERPALIAPVAEPFVERFGNRRGEDIWQMKHTLATHLASRQPQRAAELFAELSRTAADSWDATTAAAEQLDLMIFHPEVQGQAQGQSHMERVRRVVARMYANRGPRKRALLQTRIGDAHRVAGRYEEARRAYDEAQRTRGREIEPRQAAVMKRAYRETALSRLDQGRYPALRDQLLQWEADFPTAKLEGDLLLLLGRYFEAVGDDARAATEYRTLLEMNPIHPRRPEIAYRLGASLQRMNEPAAAREWLEEVVERFPNSRFAGEAERALR